MPAALLDGVATAHLLVTVPGNSYQGDNLYAYFRKGQLVGEVLLSAFGQSANSHTFATIVRLVASHTSTEWKKLVKQARTKH